MNKKNRLKKKRDFENIFKKGKSVNGSFLFIKYKKNQLGWPRFGFVVSAKVAAKAIERNKIRRILSEAARSIIDSLESYDIIVFSSRKIIAANKKSIREDFMGVLNQIR